VQRLCLRDLALIEKTTLRGKLTQSLLHFICHILSALLKTFVSSSDSCFLLYVCIISLHVRTYYLCFTIEGGWRIASRSGARLGNVGRRRTSEPRVKRSRHYHPFLTNQDQWRVWRISLLLQPDRCCTRSGRLERESFFCLLFSIYNVRPLPSPLL
jgi:hypothetical protein